MVKVREDLTGQTFGRLTVIEQVEDYINQNGKHRARWKCQCECSNVVEVVGVYLKNSKTQSCGCLNRERIVEHTKKCNDYEVQEDYVIMYTCNNEPFFIDIEDFWKVRDICWNSNGCGYLCGWVDNKKILLHRLIMDCPDNMVVDHINHDVSDNRKNNLRIVTHQQNMTNLKKSKNNTSGTTGVSWDKYSKKWAAYIAINNKTIKLGRFANIDDAIKARKEAEQKYFGEYSYDNSQKIGGRNEVSTDRN